MCPKIHTFGAFVTCAKNCGTLYSWGFMANLCRYGRCCRSSNGSKASALISALVLSLDQVLLAQNLSPWPKITKQNKTNDNNNNNNAFQRNLSIFHSLRCSFPTQPKKHIWIQNKVVLTLSYRNRKPQEPSGVRGKVTCLLTIQRVLVWKAICKQLIGYALIAPAEMLSPQSLKWETSNEVPLPDTESLQETGPGSRMWPRDQGYGQGGPQSWKSKPVRGVGRVVIHTWESYTLVG